MIPFRTLHAAIYYKMELIWSKVDFPKRNNGESPGNLYMYMYSGTPPNDHLIIIIIWLFVSQTNWKPVISLILQPH